MKKTMNELGKHRVQDLKERLSRLTLREESDLPFLNETLVYCYKLVHEYGFYDVEIKEHFK